MILAGESARFGYPPSRWAVCRNHDVVPDDELAGVADEPATMALNAVANHQYDPPASRLLGTIFDGVARHSQDGEDFLARSMEVGCREAVRDRDRPFQDDGERPRPA